MNPSAPQRYHASILDGPQHLSPAPTQLDGLAWRDRTLNVSKKGLSLPIRVPLRTGEAGGAELRVWATLFYCREDNTGVCKIKTLAWSVPVEVTSDAGAPREITLRAKVE